MSLVSKPIERCDFCGATVEQVEAMVASTLPNESQRHICYECVKEALVAIESAEMERSAEDAG